ncbi:MAG: AAA family ATPase [Deltaproteobacteria bacterium]|nr:AAA family ATPase [Deltaproteobacteria bacterium]
MTPASKILLTGVPGIGKTTLIRAVAEQLQGQGLAVSGFYTAEERGAHGRTGFLVVTLDGKRGRLATTARTEGPRLGRYTVQLHSFEATALPSIAVRAGVDLFVLDEIGKMECLSPRFVAAVRQLLGADVTLLATVAQRGTGLIAEAKARPDVEVVEVTCYDRDGLVEELTARLQPPNSRQNT